MPTSAVVAADPGTGTDNRTATVARFVDALRVARVECQDEPALLARVAPLCADLAARRADWLTAPMCRTDPEQGFGMHVLHEEVDHTLAVFVVTWLPGRFTAPHDHGTWAVIAGLEGSERNTLWERQDDGTRPGHAALRRTRRAHGRARRAHSAAHGQHPQRCERQRGRHGVAPCLRPARQLQRTFAVRPGRGYRGALSRAGGRMNEPVANEQDIAALTAAIRAWLVQRRAALDAEVRRYPTPIAACDLHLPALLEERAAVVRLLGEDDPRRLAERFVTVSAGIDGAKDMRLRAQALRACTASG